MKMNINPEWLLRMADKEANGIISVGGLVCRIDPSAVAKGDDGDQSRDNQVDAVAELAEAVETMAEDRDGPA
jgi:hypothetical protein